MTPTSSTMDTITISMRRGCRPGATPTVRWVTRREERQRARDASDVNRRGRVLRTGGYLTPSKGGTLVRSNRLHRRLAVVAAGLAIALVGAGSAEAAAKSSQSDDLRADGRVAIALTDQNQLVSFKVRNPDQPLSVRNARGLLHGVRL